MSEQPEKSTEESEVTIEDIRRMLTDYHNRRGLSRALIFPEEKS